MMEAEECWSVGIAESSPLTRSFWMGLYLQRVKGTESTRSHITDSAPDASLHGPQYPCCRAELARRYLTVEGTSLSPAVYALVTHIPSQVVGDTGPHMLSVEGTLNWTAVKTFLKQAVNMADKDFTSGGRKCAELAVRVLQELTQRGLLRKLANTGWFTWTQSPQLFVSLVERVWSGEGLETHTGLLLGTAALERALREVYVSVSGGSRAPLLLRDLLATPELEQVLGPTAVYVLCCLIGPPTGLNLRNIVWHGFSSHSEIPSQYIKFLLLVTASLHPLLPSPTHSTHRHSLTLTHSQQLTTVFRPLEPGEWGVVDELLTSTFFILPTMLPIWRGALDTLRSGRHAHCLVLLLPALEHGLRRVFACVNCCPQRVLTAEATTLYTTLDEILSPTVVTGGANKLITEIGVGKMEMLLDILTHSEGPRLRDRVSHGEVDLCDLPESLANHVLCVSLLFCAQYSLNTQLLTVHSTTTHTHTHTHTHPQTPTMHYMLETERNYVSQFHPLSLLKQQLRQLLSSLCQWDSIPRPEGCTPTPPTADSANCTTALHRALRLVRLSQCSGDLWEGGVGGVEHVREVVESVWRREGVSTLFMERQYLELVGVVRRTVDNTQQAVSQVQETARLRYSQFRDKQLRSRQRPNYHHLLSSLGLYQCSVLLLTVLSLATLSHIPQDHHQHSLIKYQKKLLQVSENICSQCSPSKNRWEEVDKLCYSLPKLSQLFPPEPVPPEAGST